MVESLAPFACCLGSLFLEDAVVVCIFELNEAICPFVPLTNRQIACKVPEYVELPSYPIRPRNTGIEHPKKRAQLPPFSKKGQYIFPFREGRFFCKQSSELIKLLAAQFEVEGERIDGHHWPLPSPYDFRNWRIVSARTISPNSMTF